MTPIEDCREWLRNSSPIAVLTGAGISAESGIPTFRSGSAELPALWSRYRPEDLATPLAFQRDPELVWRWYDWRRGLIARAQPNAGHLALAKWERGCDRFTLITQNVDGLHTAAGSSRVLEIHGSIWTLRCLACAAEWENHATPLPEIPPHCACGSMARPGVVWFGEGLPQGVWREAERAVRACRLLLVVGTSAVVYPAAGLVPMAREAGARIIEVNREETPVSSLVDRVLRGPAGEILPGLLDS